MSALLKAIAAVASLAVVLVRVFTPKPRPVPKTPEQCEEPKTK